MTDSDPLRAIHTIARENGVGLVQAGARELDRLAGEAAAALSAKSPLLLVIRHDAGNTALNLGALRHLAPAGEVLPLFCPAGRSEIAELAQIAACTAATLRAPALLVAEDLLPEDPPPGDLHPPALERLSEGPIADALASWRFDPAPAALGSSDWLVLSMGACAQAAHQATCRAREAGVAADFAAVRTLWPVSDLALGRLLRGKRFVVIAERNLGQWRAEVALAAAGASVVPAACLGRDQASWREAILSTLLRFPRCC